MPSQVLRVNKPPAVEAVGGQGKMIAASDLDDHEEPLPKDPVDDVRVGVRCGVRRPKRAASKVATNYAEIGETEIRHLQTTLLTHHRK